MNDYSGLVNRFDLFGVINSYGPDESLSKPSILLDSDRVRLDIPTHFDILE